MILLCFFAIIFAFAKFMMGLLIITQNNHQARQPLLHLGTQLWQAFLLQKTWILGALVFLLMIWLGSVIDIWKDKINSEL